MPLVQRHIRLITGCAFSTTVHPHVFYVPPSQVKTRDTIVEPTDKQLSDLAARYPQEYGKLAKDRGVTPLRVRRERDAFVDPDEVETFVKVEAEDEEDEDLDDDQAPDTSDLDDDDEGSEGALSPDEFARLAPKQAAGAIAACTDQEALARWFDTEKARTGGPRKSVLDAFAQKAE